MQEGVGYPAGSAHSTGMLSCQFWSLNSIWPFLYFDIYGITCSCVNRRRTASLGPVFVLRGQAVCLR